MNKAKKQEAVMLDTLALLQETVEYLRRLPPVPVTTELCVRIEEHLRDPEVRLTKWLAEEAALLVSERVARRFAPSGQLVAEVVVRAKDVTYRIPPLLEFASRGPRSLLLFKNGDTLKF